MTQLENKLQREFDEVRVAVGIRAGDGAESIAVSRDETRTGDPELLTLEQIEELRPELQACAFGNARPLEKAELLIPSARSEASTRDSSPNPHAKGAAKHAVLNQLRTVRLPPLLQPATTSGRMAPTPKLAFSKGVEGPAHVILSGKPRWNVVIPSTPQPERIGDRR